MSTDAEDNDGRIITEPPDDGIAIGESPDGDTISGDESRWLLAHRRDVLIGLGALATFAAIAEADLDSNDGGGGTLYGGTMALSNTYKVGPRTYMGPDSMKNDVLSEIPDDEGWRFIAPDTDVEYYLDDGSWNLRSIGSSTQPVPSVTTDRLSHKGQHADVVIFKDGSSVVARDNAGNDIDEDTAFEEVIKSAIANLGSSDWHLFIAPGDYTCDIPSGNNSAIEVDTVSDAIIDGAGPATYIHTPTGVSFDDLFGLTDCVEVVVERMRLGYDGSNGAASCVDIDRGENCIVDSCLLEVTGSDGIAVQIDAESSTADGHVVRDSTIRTNYHGLSLGAKPGATGNRNAKLLNNTIIPLQNTSAGGGNVAILTSGDSQDIIDPLIAGNTIFSPDVQFWRAMRFLECDGATITHNHYEGSAVGIQIDSSNTNMNIPPTNRRLGGAGNTFSGTSTERTVLASDGSSAEPAINFANDPNTGIYRPDDDNIALVVGGSVALVINEFGDTQLAVGKLIDVDDGASGNEGIQFSGGAGFYVNGSGEIVAVDEAGNETTIS